MPGSLPDFHVELTEEDLRQFVSSLGLRPDVEKRFLEMTPGTYVGLAPQLVDYLD